MTSPADRLIKWFVTLYKLDAIDDVGRRSKVQCLNSIVSKSNRKAVICNSVWAGLMWLYEFNVFGLILYVPHFKSNPAAVRITESQITLIAYYSKQNHKDLFSENIYVLFF